MSQTVKFRKSTKITNMGTVVFIGIIYALDVCYIALACSLMTPLELQPLTTYHNDHMWLSRTVPRCIYAIFDIQRQSRTCSGTVYPFYTHITVRACTYMFMLEFQLVIPYHNRHTHCPRLSPSVMSDLEMVYIQHGTVRDSHI